jgi:DivIVA domain-containing protein
VKTETRLPVALRGYDRAQVDTLLERITATLRHGRWGLTADDVRRIRFDIVLRGYEQRAVDELLQEAVRELRAAAPERALPQRRDPGRLRRPRRRRLPRPRHRGPARHRATGDRP